ncbi:amidase [Paractinoplanes durhamensis]|uniref:Amidase n=1 Tax=Paractinoplanes durhamensis TaxID=113563 RepID=A0ABQ3Z743_9ACTN|nr:amidase [Actinoplanes durhamensis]GIE05633.1 amidase [Actinoplanes durhamensis]
MTALHELSATALAALIRAGSVTSAEVTVHHLDRIARLDGRLGAFATVTAELALSQARRADRVLAAAGPEGVGPLHGVPVAVKDNIDVEDVPTGWGSASRGDEAVGDDNVVTRLRAAHLPILGKTHLPEFALPCHSENAVGAATVNPWRSEFTPGGSSGGSAAAVSAGLAPMALGTDAGGSVRTPASCCGLIGVRPSNGTVSNGPSDPAVTGLSTPGVLTRTAHDAAALLATIAGSVTGDMTAPRPYAEPPSPLRIGLSTEPMLPDLEVDPDCRKAAETLAARLAEAGHEVIPVDLGKDVAVADAFRDAWSVVAAAFEVDDEDDLEAFTRWMRERGRGVSGERLHECLTMFRGVARMLDEMVFDAVDLLVTPTLGQPPQRRGAFRASPDEAVNFDAMTRFMPFTPMYNIAGMPAVSVPVLVADGLPIGAMLGGRHGSEWHLLREIALVEARAGGPGGPAPGWE